MGNSKFSRGLGIIFLVLAALAIVSALAEGVAAYCGDGLCNNGETCATCSNDCGSCGPICGNSIVETGEDCERPGTSNNANCGQDTKDCDGKKTGTRDSYGNCNSGCGCSDDSFSNYKCVKGSCGATCGSDSDCNDGNSNTIDKCESGCTCSHTAQPYCGDGKITTGEDCEKPSTNNNAHCSQSTTGCDGKKTGTRDNLGNCNSGCDCVKDPFTNYKCVKGSCGAECAADSDCNDGNSNTIDKCESGCTCSHTTQPYCGDNIVNNGETCEKPSTNNNAYCGQSTTGCDGKKTGTRDAFGNCNSACGCAYDSFSDFQCVKGSCGAECAADSDCNDGNSNTIDKCESGCTCSHTPSGYCGDGQLNNGEACEYPNTFDNWHCCQPTSECNGPKLGTRDEYGSCNSGCGCTQDPFTYNCVAGSCGATCSDGETQTEACGTDIGECSSGTRTRTCSGTTCSFGEWGQCTGAKGASTEICDGKDNDCDGQVDEDLIQTCGSGICSGSKTCSNGQWSGCTSEGKDAGTCARCSSDGKILYDSTQDQDCSNGLFCDGTETCSGIGQCAEGNAVACTDTLFCTVNERCDEATDSCIADPMDCSGFNLYTLETCDHTPDNNPFTWDFAESGFISACDEEQDTCTQGEYGDITHECSAELCGAECESSSDCIAGHSCSGCVCTCSPSAEICDGLDNDCDSRIDEDNACGPKIVSTPNKRMCVTKAGENSDTYIYNVDALDPDDPFLAYLLVQSPHDMFIDPNSGLITWTFGQYDIGSSQVIVKAEDREFTHVDSDCYDYVDPVCAENGNTFKNTCELAAAGQGLWHYGYCYDMQAYNLEICKPGEEIYPRRKFGIENLNILNAEPICAGDELQVLFTLQNDGIFDNKDIVVSFVAPEIAEKRTIGPFRLDEGEEITKHISLYIPEETPTGMYELRVYLYAQNGDFHRIKHRDFIVVQCGEYSCRRDIPVCDPYYEDC